MIGLTGNSEILMCMKPIDFRKGIESLTQVTQEIFLDKLLSGSYFVFLNMARNKIKVLYWDLDGFVVWYKRLERGVFSEKLSKEQMDRRDFLLLLEGIIPKKTRPRFF